MHTHCIHGADPRFNRSTLPTRAQTKNGEGATATGIDAVLLHQTIASYNIFGPAILAFTYIQFCDGNFHTTLQTLRTLQT